jgi:hypothetical protein
MITGVVLFDADAWHRDHPERRLAGGKVFVKALRNERSESLAQLPHVANRIPLLKKVGVEFGLVDLGVAGNAAPEFVAAEFAVVRPRRLGGECYEDRRIDVCGIGEHAMVVV